MSLRFLVHTALLASVVSTIAVAAMAQAGSAVQSLAGPRTLRVVSHRSTEHGCSMSRGHSTAELSLVLSIDRAGTAVLAIEGESHSRIWSRSSGGSETGHAVSGVARGTSSLDGDGQLTVRFVDLDLATAYWSGPGTAPVGPSTLQPFVHSLRCTVESATLLPAGAPSAGEVGLPTTLAHCAWASGVPSELTGYTEADTWLGAGSGIELHSDDTLREPGPNVTLRAR
jgi:hypothetical protein